MLAPVQLFLGLGALMARDTYTSLPLPSAARTQRRKRSSSGKYEAQPDEDGKRNAAVLEPASHGLLALNELMRRLAQY